MKNENHGESVVLPLAQGRKGGTLMTTGGNISASIIAMPLTIININDRTDMIAIANTATATRQIVLYEV